MDYDIGPILEGWDYQAGQVVVRKFIATDGTEKLQLRADLGILQMNVEGRPDGKRPMGYPSLYEYYQARLYQHTARHDGDESGFALAPEDCAKLQFEGMQYHQRAFCLLHLDDFAGVIRDAERNQAVLEFVKKHTGPDLLAPFLHFVPQQVMVLTRARAGLCLAVQDFTASIRHIEDGIEQIRAFFREQDRPELADQCGELLWLDAWLKEVAEKRPISKREKLERDLREAVQTEDYEKAAQVRDELRRLDP
jgi:hypothetical protein